MPYNIFSVDISTRSDTANTPIVCTQNVYSGDPAIPEKVNTSIVSRLTMSVRVAATDDGDGATWANKTIIFTPRMFTLAGMVSLPTSTTGFTFNTGAQTSGVTYAGSWNGEAASRANGEATLTFTQATAIFTYTFHVASHLDLWPPAIVINNFRFLSTSNGGAYLTDNQQTAYNNTDGEMQLAIRIKSNITASNTFASAVYLDEWRNEQRVFRLPICPKWYGRNAGSSAWAWRVNSFTIDTGGVRIAESAFTNFDDYNEAYDDNFLISDSSICPFGNNVVTLTYNEGEGVDPASITHAQLFLIRTDNVSNAINYIDAYDFQEHGLLTAGANTIPSGVFAGAAVASFFQASGSLRFNIDGTELEYGACYRVGAILHDSGACNSWSLLSHELCADKLPQCTPDTTLELGNFCSSGGGVYGLFAPHERISTCVTFDMSPFFTCMQAAGLDVSLDNLLYVSLLALFPADAGVTDVNDASMTNIFATGFTGGEITSTPISNVLDSSVTIDGNVIRACAVTRLADLYDPAPNSPLIGTFVPFSWVVELDVVVPNGQVERVRLRATQQIGIRDWGVYSNQDSLSVTAWNGDLWPEKVPVLSLCNVEKIVFEVLKFGALTGESVSLQTQLYARPPAGILNMVTGVTGHDAQDVGDTSIVQQLNELPVFDVTEFSGDVATFSVLVSDLPVNQEVCVDVVVCEGDLLDCCPVIGNVSCIFYTRRTGNRTFVYCLPGNLTNAVNNADDPGIASVIGIHDIIGAPVTYLWQQNTVLYVELPSNTQPAALTWRFDITSNFTCEDGNVHTIRHELRVNVPLPTSNQGWVLMRSAPEDINCIDIT